MINKRRITPVLIVSIIATAVLIGGGLIWYFVAQSDTENTNTITTNTNLPKTNTNTTINTNTNSAVNINTGANSNVNTNQTANTNVNENTQLNWENYSSPITGFSLQYPEEFSAQLESSDMVDFANYDIMDSEYEAGNPDGVKIQIQKHNFNVGRIESAQQLVRELREAKDYASSSITAEAAEDIVIGNYITLSKKTISGPGGALTTFIAISDDEETYYNIIVFEPGYSNNAELVEQILSTFEIL